MSGLAFSIDSSALRCCAAALLLAVGCTGDDDDDGASADSGDETGSDEEAWSTALELDTSQGVLLSVWGPSPDQLRTVGGQIDAIGEDGVGLMLRRDGGTWVAEDLPDGTKLLNWIHGVDGVVWAVGNGGNAIRLDGGAWVTDDTPVDVPLWGVFAVSADEAWAVGGDPFDSMGTGVIVHYTGGAWQDVELPTLDRAAPALFKVWAASAGDVHVVGDNGVILHYDGSAWTQVQSGTTEDLISLWGTGADEVLAVGGRSNGVIARYDGASWSSTVLAATPPLNGIWMDASGAAILAGERGSVSRVGAGSMEASALDTPASLDVLHAAFGFDGGLEVAVGGTLQNPPPYTGIIFERQ